MENKRDLECSLKKKKKTKYENLESQNPII